MMSLNQIRSKFGGDFRVPSFYGSIENAPRKSQSMNTKLCKIPIKENNVCRGSAINIKTSRHPGCNNQRNKQNPALRNPLKDKNIGDSSFPSNIRINNRSLKSSRTSTHDEEQDEGMVTARNTSDCSIETLKEKAVPLNFELSKHVDYITNHIPSQNIDHDELNYSDSSDIALERKYTRVFQESSRPSAPIYKNQLDTITKTSQIPPYKNDPNNDEFKLILKILKRVFKPSPLNSQDSSETTKLYEIVKTLQNEQKKFRGLITAQQQQLDNFQSKYLKAENIIKSQKYDIQKLNRTNTQLRNELHFSIGTLKAQLQEKTNEFAHLPQEIKNEKLKAEKLSKQNCELITRLQEVKHELALTRAKLVEADQKRSTTLHKLKSSEKDLKLFRNQNNILKTEKRTLIEELKRLKAHNEELTKKIVQNMSRQKERGESQQRQLQRKILDLELELTRSRNSTGDLIEERDKLIAELHQQLNTLVHNFQVSQKHIRVLRKHIQSMSGSPTTPKIPR